MTVSAKIETVTPQKAEAWLGKAAGNRNIRATKVAEYAAAMTRGEWKLSGEAIKFNGQDMIDGQHRLKAVIESGQSVPMLVVRGLETDVMEVLDTGRKRTLADLLKIRGEVSALNLAAALTGLHQTRIAIETGTWPMKQGKTAITNQQALTLLEEEPTIRDSVVGGWINLRAQRHGLYAQPTALVVGYHIFSDIDEEDRDHFYRMLQGIDVPDNSPVLHFRRRFSGGFDMPTNRRDHIAYLFKTWNYWRNGEFPALLSWKSGGKKPERFPVPV